MSDCFRINGGVRQVCIISLWLFNIYMDVLMKELKMEMGRRGVREESGDYLVSCMQMIWFCVASRRKT